MEEPRVQRFQPIKSMSLERLHMLAEFDEPPTPDQTAELERRGIHIVQYVPDTGYVVSVRPGTRWEGSAARRLSRVASRDKISAALKGERPPLAAPDQVVAEFHPDVDPQVARSIVQLQGFEVVEHPNMLPHHLLVRVPPDRLEDLAGWDEVAYLFPASTDLAAGESLIACPGALTALGTVGQSTATVGDGWDGPGLGSAALVYYFQQLTQKLPADQARGEIQRAMGEWARVASLSFLPATGPGQTRSIDILFASGAHGDGYPFDGPSGILAHTFYPSPPNPETLAGDMHLDNDEEWVAGPDLSVHSVDLFSVSLHELGHALGLGHSDVPGDAMYPYYRRVVALTANDIAAIQTLYAAAGTPSSGTPPQGPLALMIASPAVFPLTTSATALSFSGSVSGGSGTVQVTWSSDRAGTGLAQGGRSWTISSLPLLTGNNVVTITAMDATPSQVSKTVFITRQDIYQPPTVTISSPATGATYATTSPSVTLSGSATPVSGLVRVQWANSRGGTGVATGLSPWTAGPITLQTGDNVLTATAFDKQGGSASRSLTVTYSLARDTVAPTLSITSPSATSVQTSSATIQMQGTASDNVGVTSVTWSTSFGNSGTATGTTYWNTGNIPLLVGTNTIVVRAYDAAGNSSWRSVTVTRR